MLKWKNGCLARFCSGAFGFRDRRAPDYATRQLVAREGSAPSIPGCKPDVMLLHHRAVEIGCRGTTRTFILAFKGRCPTLRRPGNKWWPARVTLPVQRIKSPLHHFNACRPKRARRAEARSEAKSEGWSQSPVLPWAQRAYVTRLSAGSTANLGSPPPGIAPG